MLDKSYLFIYLFIKKSTFPLLVTQNTHKLNITFMILVLFNSEHPSINLVINRGGSRLPA